MHKIIFYNKIHKMNLEHFVNYYFMLTWNQSVKFFIYLSLICSLGTLCHY